MERVSDRWLGDLVQRVDRAPVDEVPSVIHEALKPAGVRHAVLYLADLQETCLRPAPGSTVADGSGPASQDLDGLAGTCFREARVVDDPGSGRVWAPVAERADVIGVLELAFEGELDANAGKLCEDAGVVLAHCLVTARKYTDVYELLRRRRDMNLAAEMHWEILPPTCYVGPSVAVAGDLEPAYEVGGDAFDYCVNAGRLDFTIMDAMGHGLRAALLSMQAVSAYRFARRRGRSVEEICTTVDKTLRRQFGGRRFVTALFCRLDLRSGKLSWVNAGHVSPLLLREGKVEELDQAAPVCPVGIELLDTVKASEVTLVPGDRLLLYSDGVVEARSPDGHQLDLTSVVRLVESQHDLPIEETCHRLIAEVLRHCSAPLRDDASVLMVEYREPRPA